MAITDMAAETDSTGTLIDLATRSAVRCRVPVSVVAMDDFGISCTLARAIREASPAKMMAPSIFANSDRRCGLNSASRRKPPVRPQVGIEKKTAGADGQHLGLIPDHDQSTSFGLQNPVKAVPQGLSRSHHRQGVIESRTLACAHPRMVPVNTGYRLRWPFCQARGRPHCQTSRRLRSPSPP